MSKWPKSAELECEEIVEREVSFAEMIIDLAEVMNGKEDPPIRRKRRASKTKRNFD